MEYGGFLPLELNPGEEYFTEYEDDLYRYNSVKAALCALIKRLNPQKIYLPYYYCPSTTEAIRNTGISLCFYHINDSLMPETVPDESGTIVLLVDYFGVCQDQISELSGSYKNANVIIDRAHAFYEHPIADERTHTVYSARKFFGVPDGAYLISKAKLSHMDQSRSYEYAGYLIRSYEEGTNAAYAAKKEADITVGNNYAGMSALSAGLLRNADYGRVRRRRSDNYRVLYEAFRDINELDIPEEKPAYLFPLLISSVGDSVKKRLVEEQIYVPTLWSGKELIENGNDFELNMSKNAIFLPLDQRYAPADMKYMDERVKSIIREIR